MRLGLIIATNRDNTAGKVVSEVMPYTQAMDRFREMRRAGEFPAGADLPLVVLCPLSADASFRVRPVEVTSVTPVTEVTDASEAAVEAPAPAEVVTPRKQRKRRNPGDGQA